MSAEVKVWSPVPGKSQVSFRAGFQLGDFEGRGEAIAAELRVDPADLRQAISGSVRVSVGGLRTGVAGRDRDMWKILEAERFPQIRFAVEGVEPSFPSVSDKGDVLLTIRGQMLIRDVERPLTFLGRARLRDEHLWVRGDAMLRMTDFGLTPPKRLFFSVRDQVTVTFDLTLAPAE